MFAQLLINCISNNNKKTFFSKAALFIFIFIRKTYLKFNKNALVKYKLHNHLITLPLRHDLPIILRTYKYYDSAIGRIPGLLKQKYPVLQAIDVGANIGDTAILIKSYLDIPVLCIEADEYYFQLLVDNTKSLKDIYYEKCYVGKGLKDDMKLISYKGSARLTKSSNNSQSINFKSLHEIIQSHQNFNKIKFLKIDTDGFDCNIIRANLEFLKNIKPVIYFEYDPFFLKMVNDDGLSVFDSLDEAGYNNLIIYDNTGRYILSTNLSDKKLLEELHLYFSGRNGGLYMDICAFHKNDNDIAEICKKSEFEFSLNTLENISNNLAH